MTPPMIPTTPNTLEVGIEFTWDPPGKPGTPAPATFAGIARRVKTSHRYFRDFLPSFFGIVSPAWLSDSLRYNWAPFDRELAAWEAAGYQVDTVVLSAAHPVFCAPSDGPAPSSVAGYAPKSSTGWAELRRFARAFVTRYRGRIRVLEVESEPQVRYWWADELDSYLRWLAIAYEAVRDLAAGTMFVCLGGHTFNGFVDDAPTEAVFRARVDALPEPRRSEMVRALDFGQKCLSQGLFHVIDYHSLGAPSGIVPAVELTLDYVPLTWSGEIHVGDAFPGLPVYKDPLAYNPGQVDLLPGLLAKDPSAVAELEARQVTTTRAKIEAAQAVEARIVHFGPTRDWSPSPYPWQGLTRPNGTLRPVCVEIAKGAP